MGVGNRFPLMASKKAKIQVVGPSSGSCQSIVQRAAKYIKEETARDFKVEVKCSQSRLQIGDSDGIFFLFLHPTHSSFNEATNLNAPIIGGLRDWFLQSMDSGKNVYVLYEGVEDEVSGAVTSEMQKHGLLDARFTEYTVDKGDTSSMYSFMVANSNNIK